jgi:hypothetical protein
MQKLSIQGGVPLSGEVRVAGAKNAALPILAASLLTAAPVRITNVPQLNDVGTMLKLLGRMGVKVEARRARCARRAPGGRAVRALRPGEDDARIDPRARAAHARASARRACRCPAAAPSASGPWTCTSRACARWAPTIAIEAGRHPCDGEAA